MLLNRTGKKKSFYLIKPVNIASDVIKMVSKEILPGSMEYNSNLRVAHKNFFTRPRLIWLQDFILYVVPLFHEFEIKLFSVIPRIIWMWLSAIPKFNKTVPDWGTKIYQIPYNIKLISRNFWVFLNSTSSRYASTFEIIGKSNFLKVCTVPTQ